MCLSTVSTNGKPSSRMVLLKDYSENSFTFLAIAKAEKELSLIITHMSRNLYWKTFQRQVRIEGKAEKVSREITETYFHGRPRGSQIASHCSYQSQPLPDKQTYLDRIKAMTKKFENTDVIPYKRLGMAIVLFLFNELWREGEFRTHDRFVFRAE